MSGDYMAFFADGGAVRVRDAADKSDARRKAQATVGEEPKRVEAIPYPFCWDPRNCAGRGSCPKDRACND